METAKNKNTGETAIKKDIVLWTALAAAVLFDNTACAAQNFFCYTDMIIIIGIMLICWNKINYAFVFVITASIINDSFLLPFAVPIKCAINGP